tara:strand:+ start:1289 stop:1477 length:189 start_codon:yes stop_codon:yes gene_type:complete
LSNILRKVKELERIYRERNKLLADAGLEDFRFSTKEIEKFVSEAVEKEVSKKINKTVKDSGL